MSALIEAVRSSRARARNHADARDRQQLHRLDVAAYFRDLIRVLPYWPRDRFLELCPRDWARTRARLDATELERELGHITVPTVDPQV